MTKKSKANSRAKKNTGVRKIKGRGDYQTFNLRGMAQKLDQALSSIPKGAFAYKGAQMGSRFGPLGALAGKGLGAGLAAVTGYGNYSVRANSLSKVSTSVDMIPQFVKNDHSVRVTHREFVKDLVVPINPSSFVLEDFLINPANKTLFPWLATMARQYSQYKIHGMVFAYKTMSSDITSGGALGTVIMATNYNAIDRAYQSKIEMENSEFAVSTKPSMSLVHAIECDPKYSGLDVLYVRDPSYETTDTNDRRFYDYGRFQLATTGLPGTTGTVMGEIWVSYDIEFMKPVLGGNELPTYIQGASVISKANGSVGVQSSQNKICSVIVTGTALNPASSTTYNLLPDTYTVSGDTGIVGTAISINSTNLVLRRNGEYTISLSGVAASSAANQVLAPATGITNIALNGAGTGATVSIGPIGVNNLSFAAPPITSTTGYSYLLQWNVVVSGIENDSEFVTVTPTTFTSNTGACVTGWIRTLSVDWVALGTNSQDPNYTYRPPS